MKKRNFYILFFLLLQGAPVFAQNDSVNLLAEVVLSDVRLYKNSPGNTVTVLKDSVLEHNQPSLMSVLKFNSPIHFKENGPGMVASASFRGTTASQTAVIWNGININSQFTGQTDFNTLFASGYDHIGIRSGGGSVLYGSGAIGGSVHLNNSFRFGKGFENELRLKYGSFNTFFGDYHGDFSSEDTNVQLQFSRHSSDNDFNYPDGEKANVNGDFKNTGFNAALAHILDEKNTLKLYTQYYDGGRGFSGTLTAPSKSRFEDVNSRNLLEWKGLFNSFTSNLRLAYLDEKYRYYENREQEAHVYGNAKTGIVKYDLAYELTPDIVISGIAHVDHTTGEGTNIGEQERTTGSLGFLFSHELDRFRYQISGRKEITDSYDSPLLFSLSSGYEVTDSYRVKLNFSKNYRIPTFNDLFWYAGGNRELEPEKSLQAEIGQDLELKDLKISLIGFVMEIDNLLRWIPGADGLWKPQNTKSVRNYGLEAVASWEKEYGDHHFLFSGTYAYTHSEDQTTGKMLIYVPRHKLTASAGYGFRKFSAFYQFLNTGRVYTSSDNNYSLDSYLLSNIGVDYDLLKTISLGVEVLNLWDVNYQSMPSRPMPGRSYNTKLTFKF